jgi:ketosteroid isomerase-like protein
MKRRTMIGRWLLIGAALASPAPLQGQSPDRSESAREVQPSIEIPGELERVLRDYERYWSGGQEAELAALFVAEGLIVNGGSWIRGRSAIQEAYRDATGPLRLRAIEFAADGDVGYIVGAYGYGEFLPVEDRGMFVLTLRRDTSGRWLIVSDLDRGAG